MSRASARRRGRETELWTGDYWDQAGFDVSVVPANLGGADLVVPGLSVEIKARSDRDIQGALRQAETRPGLPVVVMRLNGQGRAQIGEWVALTRHKHMIDLLRETGF